MQTEKDFLNVIIREIIMESQVVNLTNRPEKNFLLSDKQIIGQSIYERTYATQTVLCNTSWTE